MDESQETDETRQIHIRAMRQASITIFYIIGAVFGASMLLMWIFIREQYMLDMAIFSLLIITIGMCIDRRRVYQCLTCDEYHTVIIMGIFLVSVSAVFIMSAMIYENAYFYVDAYFSKFYAFFVACSLLSAPFALRPTIRAFRELCCS